MLNKEYTLISRSGQKHRLVETEPEWYAYVPAEEWMMLYITGGTDGPIMIDTDGGPALSRGTYITDTVMVDNIAERDEKTRIHLIEK